MHDKIERYIRTMRAYYEKHGASPDFIDQLELQWRRVMNPPTSEFNRWPPMICPYCSEDVETGEHASCRQHAREEARDAIEKEAGR